MDALQDKKGRSNIRLIILVFLFISGIVAALLYFPPILTRTAEKRTSGDITFTDGMGNLLSGTLTRSVAGTSLEPANAYSVSWTNVPNARIYFNVLAAKSLAVNLRILSDSPKGRMILENYGINMPGSVNVSAPGTLVKYVEVSAAGVSFAEAEVSVQYTDAEVAGLNESSLVLYRYDSAKQEWSELATVIDANNNIASTTVNSLSIFALSTRIPEKIEVRDTRNMPVSGDFRIYDQAKNLKKHAKTNTLSAEDVPVMGELEVDALASKNVAVKFRVNKAGKGGVILDDYGKNNPVSVPLPGRVVKYVEIGANNISFSYANITIRYSDSELNGGNEGDLTIYHWNGATWDALPTVIDIANKTLSATTTLLSPFGVATTFIYYFENNATVQSVGADGTTNYSATGSTITVIPYKNLLKNGTMGAAENIRYAIPSTGVPYEVFRFYLPFNYSVDTQISANASYKITWRTGASTTDTVNVSLIVYNPATGDKTVIGSAQNTTTGGGTFTAYTNTIRNPQYLVPAGSRLMVRVNTTATATGTLRFQFNDAVSSYINVTETNVSAQPNPPNITSWGNSKTNNQTANFSVNPNELVQFNATANQTITTWNWYSNDALQASNTTNTFNISWAAAGAYHVDVNATNTNGTSRTVTWNITVNALPLPNITSWGNNKTNNQASSITLNASEGVRFNATANQSITTWNWYVNDTNQNNNLSTFNTSWASGGYYHVDVNATNSNGTSSTVTWNITITLPPLPSITSWGNNKTNNATLTFTVNTSEYVKFNATANQTITTWSWFSNDVNQSWNYDNFTTSWASTGSYSIKVNATNANGTSSTITWSVTVSTPSVSGKILVATNRYVVLDDPAAGTASTNYVNPDAQYTSNIWSGVQTTIGVKALLIDSNGLPLSGKTVNFTIYRPPSTQYVSGTNITDSSGVASFYRDLNGANFWGNWTVKADYSGTSQNTTFIYNWWGCAWNQGVCAGQHNGISQGTNWVTASPNSPYTHSDERVTGLRTDHNTGISGAGWADDYCTVCHQNYDGNPTTGITAATTTKDFIPPDTHSNKGIRCDNSSCHDPGASFANHNAGTITIGSCTSASCHPFRTNITMKTTLNGVVSNYSNSSSGGVYDDYHTPNSTVPCIICHGPMHNISKPDQSQRFKNNSVTEDTQCTTCHSSYTQHNASNTTSGGVNCTLCHSQDVHVIKVFSNSATYINLNRTNPTQADLQNRGNCTNCHQNATFFVALEAQPKAGNYTGRDPPIVAAPLEHSNDPSAGAKWKQTYWTNNNQLTWCTYCHGDTKHSSIALGRPASWDGNNIVNSSLTQNTTWCAGCHWQGYANGSNTYNDMVNAFTGAGLLVPPEISGNGANGANTSIYEYTNHSLYTGFSSNLNDSTCDRCHGYNYPFTTITQLMHNQTRVGGANCADCHDIGGIALLAHVNVTAANDTSAIHKNLNINASGTNSSAYYNNSKRCWACHSNGSEPSTPNAHPTSYKLPDNCTDCHIQSATQNFNFTPYAILNVSEHYWNGTDIHTPAVSACYACHNKSEMLISANDPDNGSGAVYGGLNGGNSSTSHYGKKRADLRAGINATCSYCHQNDSTVFSTAMIDPTYNRSINNHSWRYNSSTPACTSSQCHSTGWIHNSTLVRPNFTLPNSTFCLNCHGRNSTTGLINFTGAVTSIKEPHNNTINCTECHLGSSRDIHPVKYLQSNTSYNTSNSTAVDCTNCHQNLTVYPSLSRTPPKIPNPMYHSDNFSNGTLWNSTGYWTNVTVTSCTYCHNDTKHNATALGRPAYWKGDNTVNSSITSTSNWCAGCHYRGYSSGTKNYSDMTSIFTAANLPVPPEITNGTYAPYNFSRYYNHSLRNYTDVACKLCHGINLTSNTLVTAFVHNITWGACTDCHYSFSAMNITTRPDRYVNSTLFNASPHGSVSCSNCHTKGHKNIGARKACEDCHAYQQSPLTDRNRHNITRTPSTYMYNGTSVVNITTCTTCHDSTQYTNATTNYGYNKARDCDYCHTYPDKTYS